PAAVAYLDADGEYFGADIEAVVAPVLAGQADYVVGSRFTGQIERMLVRRRVGNQVLTAALRWAARRNDITDGQSGYRAFSPAAAAAAEIVHDYNYAQVLTLDLLGKGYRYAEVPISYRFRSTGTSFIRLGRYLRRVLPAAYRELNASPPPHLSREFPATGPVEAGGLPRQLGADAAVGQSSTTWAANRRRAARHAASSNVVPPPSASTAS
ncbi:MAG: glycosyl transferase, family 2, partial [Pseudonocardia sp.]|nr:glycosyl transferase, family 2 [Pseudonocardia sp.]